MTGETLSIHLGPELNAALLAKARACGLPVSDLVRWGVHAVIHGYAQEGIELQALRGRVARIVEAHHKRFDGHGGTLGDCNECGWQHPCPTHLWATTDRDPALSTWDPADDETDETIEWRDA